MYKSLSSRGANGGRSGSDGSGGLLGLARRLTVQLPSLELHGGEEGEGADDSNGGGGEGDLVLAGHDDSFRRVLIITLVKSASYTL